MNNDRMQCRIQTINNKTIEIDQRRKLWSTRKTTTLETNRTTFRTHKKQQRKRKEERQQQKTKNTKPTSKILYIEIYSNGLSYTQIHFEEHISISRVVDSNVSSDS